MIKHFSFDNLLESYLEHGYNDLSFRAKGIMLARFLRSKNKTHRKVKELSTALWEFQHTQDAYFCYSKHHLIKSNNFAISLFMNNPTICVHFKVVEQWIDIF